jgi:hypothetical protein
MQDAIETPAALRRKAIKCDYLADHIPTPGDAALLRCIARECREAAERIEAAMLSNGAVPSPSACSRA